jgi:hypothetical protein
MGRHVVKYYQLATIVMGERTNTNYSRVKFFLGCWPILFNQEWWDHICYMVLDSPSICHSREPMISRFLGHKWWSAVPGVQDPDYSP